MTRALLSRCLRYVGNSIADEQNDSDEKHTLLAAISAELAKPEQPTERVPPMQAMPIEGSPDKYLSHAEGWNNCVMAMLKAEQPTTAPAWRDAPTCNGAWVGKELSTGHAQCFYITDVEQAIKHLAAVDRWLGPIPEDK